MNRGGTPPVFDVIAISAQFRKISVKMQRKYYFLCTILNITLSMYMLLLTWFSTSNSFGTIGARSPHITGVWIFKGGKVFIFCMKYICIYLQQDFNNAVYLQYVHCRIHCVHVTYGGSSIRYLNIPFLVPSIT